MTVLLTLALPSILGDAAVNDLKRVSLQEVEPVPIVAKRIAVKSRGDVVQGARELGLESLCRVPAASAKVDYNLLFP
jgi:hypothetical protein